MNQPVQYECLSYIIDTRACNYWSSNFRSHGGKFAKFLIPKLNKKNLALKLLIACLLIS